MNAYGVYGKTVQRTLFEGDEKKRLIINRGIAGDTTKYLKKRFYVDAVQLKPKYCILGIGINDSIELEGDYWKKLEPVPYSEKLKIGYSLNNIQGAETVKALEQGTIVISYKATGENAIQSLFSVGNGTNGNQNRHFHIYVTNSGGVGMELRNTDGDFKYTLDRPAAVRGSYKGERVSNTIAFKADKENKKYKLFADGELIATLDKEAFKFISDITGVDNIMLGGTLRQGQVAYPFEGTINSVGVYQDVISDDELVQLTGQTTYADNIFYAGDATKSNYFRIPSLLTLDSGTVIAAADARYGGTHDSKSKINTAFAKSTDGGNTWGEPTLPMKFDDYVAKNIDWPRDSVGKNVQIQGSASYIDPVLLEDKSTHRVFLFADLMPAGIGSSNASVGSGFKEINGKKYLKLHWKDDSSSDYNYSIRENGIIYDDTTCIRMAKH